MSGQYRVILADPPWKDRERWGDPKNGKYGDRHYSTLTLDQICALPVADLAAGDCAALMWTTEMYLLDAGRILDAWGFSYRGIAFNWVKTTAVGAPAWGLGRYTRKSSELCILGIRGRMKVRARDVQQVIMAKRRTHSRKPDEQYDRIMRLFDGPYLELFARQQWPGWDVWGNEADKFPAQPFLFPESMVG